MTIEKPIILTKEKTKKREAITIVSYIKKLQTIRKKYKELFSNEKSPHAKSLNSIIRGVFEPESMLIRQLEEIKLLENEINDEENNESSKSKEVINKHLNLIKKINEMLILLNKLDVNIPSHSKSLKVSMQKKGIQIPIATAKFISRSLLKIKSSVENVVNSTEKTIDEHITLKTLKTVRKKILTVDSFFTNVSPKIEAEIKNISEKEMINFVAKVLKKPFEITEALGFKPNNLENDHPNKIIERFHKKDPLLTGISEEEIKELDDAIHKHEVVASLLNMEFSYWRRYSLLNLETIKAAKEKNISDLKSITFTETRMVNGVFDTEKITDKEEKSISTLNQVFEQSFAETCLYESYNWSLNKGILGQSLKNKGVTNIFTGFNRGMTQAGKSELESPGVPRSAFAILKPTKIDGKFEISIKKYNSHHGQDTYKNYHETMLELWINHSGDINKVEEEWNKIQEKLNETDTLPDFKTILSKVYTLPCIILSNKIHNTHDVRDLQQELAKITDPVRSNILTSSLIATFGVDESGNFAIDTRADHTNWDGVQSNEYIKHITKKMLRLSQNLQLDKQQPLVGSGNDKNIDTDRIILNGKDRNKDNQAEEGNSQVQSLISAEGLLRISDDLGKIVRKMVKDNLLDKKTKLKNPAVIMQLIFIHHYKEIVNGVGENQKIGMLMGNSDISIDLDLAPISQGFDLKFFNKLTEDGGREYLKNLAITLEIALKNTSMELIKDVVENIPNTKIQQLLNSISQTKPFREGIRDLSGTNMISHFGLPRINNDGEILMEDFDGYKTIHSSGSAKTDFQDNAVTIVGSTMVEDYKGQEKFYLSVCYKNTDNKIALKEAEEFKNIIEEYNQFYKDRWIKR